VPVLRWLESASVPLACPPLRRSARPDRRGRDC